MQMIASPDGKYLLVLNGGYNPPSISVMDAASGAEVGRTRVPDAWLGLAINRVGNRVYVGGGSTGAVHEFAFSDGKLTEGRVLSTLTKAAKELRPIRHTRTSQAMSRFLPMADFYTPRRCFRIPWWC